MRELPIVTRKIIDRVNALCLPRRLSEAEYQERIEAEGGSEYGRVSVDDRASEVLMLIGSTRKTANNAHLKDSTRISYEKAKHYVVKSRVEENRKRREERQRAIRARREAVPG